MIMQYNNTMKFRKILVSITLIIVVSPVAMFLSACFGIFNNDNRYVNPPPIGNNPPIEPPELPNIPETDSGNDGDYRDDETEDENGGNNGGGNNSGGGTVNIGGEDIEYICLDGGNNNGGNDNGGDQIQPPEPVRLPTPAVQIGTKTVHPGGWSFATPGTDAMWIADAFAYKWEIRILSFNTYVDNTDVTITLRRDDAYILDATNIGDFFDFGNWVVFCLAHITEIGEHEVSVRAMPYPSGEGTLLPSEFSPRRDGAFITTVHRVRRAIQPGNLRVEDNILRWWPTVNGQSWIDVATTGFEVMGIPGYDGGKIISPNQTFVILPNLTQGIHTFSVRALGGIDRGMFVHDSHFVTVEVVIDGAAMPVVNSSTIGGNRVGFGYEVFNIWFTPPAGFNTGNANFHIVIKQNGFEDGAYRVSVLRNVQTNTQLTGGNRFISPNAQIFVVMEVNGRYSISVPATI